jgi:predicted restriction endonuclease
MIRNFILKKEIDWSLFNYGFNIRLLKQSYIYSLLGLQLNQGEQKNVNIFFNNRFFKANLINQKFDKTKYPDHKDILQIRYSVKSHLAIELKKVFKNNYEYLLDLKAVQSNKRKPLFLTKDKKEYIILYTTDLKDTFFLDYVLQKDIIEGNNLISKLSEEQFEFTINNKIDITADIILKKGFAKIRKMDKTICDDLKKFYQYKCQICKKNFNDLYGVEIAEAHHIKSFVKSLNNNSENIMVLCPDHHRLIHKANPIFDFSKKLFHYPNGFMEKLTLNYHL